MKIAMRFCVNSRFSIWTRTFSRIGMVAICCIIVPYYTAKGQEKPNIILILSDDAGFHDFGFQGSKEIRTPNLDRLALESVRFSEAYVSGPVCGPSRAGLMTGIYQGKFGFWGNNTHTSAESTDGAEYEDLGLRLDQVTMAERLKGEGYRNKIVGKWHLGGTEAFHPLNRGFDEFFGFRGGARSYWPYEEGSGRKIHRLERSFGDFEEHRGYLTDRLGEEAVDFVRRWAGKVPFFLFLSFNAPHAPMHAKAEDLALFPDLEGLRRRYAAMVFAMDRAIGAVLEAVEETGAAESTLIVFTNDNGGPSHVNSSSNYPLSGVKSNLLEGGIRVPLLLRPPSSWDLEPFEFRFPVTALDLFPTFVSAGGGMLPGGLDGANLKPYLTGKRKGEPHRSLMWQYQYGRAAIREGDWKLIRLPDRPAELFNIGNDPSELDNLAMQNPDIVGKMYKKLFEWEQTMDEPMWNTDLKWRAETMRLYDEYKQKRR